MTTDYEELDEEYEYTLKEAKDLAEAMAEAGNETIYIYEMTTRSGDRKYLVTGGYYGKEGLIDNTDAELLAVVEP